MDTLARWWRRLRGLARTGAREREMDAEIRFHLEMEQADLVRKGLPPDQARRRARVAFGGVEQAKEDGRDARGGRWIEDLARDVRGGFRGIRTNPGYAAVVVLTLALGIGATATIFSAVNSVLLRQLPYSDPSRLFLLWDGLDWIGVPEAWLRGTDVIRLREETTQFAGFAVVRPGSAALSEAGRGEAEQIRISRTSADFFDLLGTRPALGRLFRPGEDAPGSEPVVVLGHRLWLRRWGRDSTILGRRIELDGAAATVVGILPADFRFATQSSLGAPSDADLYLPYTQVLADLPPWNHSLGAVARVMPGVTVTAAKAELAALSKRIDQEEFATKGFKFVAISLQERLVREVRPALITLMVAVVLLLAIMCANLATLALARAAQRQREFTVRAALGAGGGRIAAQLVTETLVVSVVGGFLGLGLGLLGVKALLVLAPAGLPRREEIGVDLVVAGFTLLVAVAVGLAMGAVPAHHAGRRDAATVLRELSLSIGGARSRGALVLVQIALSTVLLAGTALLLISFVKLSRTNPGFSAEGVLTVEMRAVPSRYGDNARLTGLYRTVLERLAVLPSVQSVGASSSPPLSASADQYPVSFPGSPTNTGEPDHDRSLVDVMSTTAGYFVTMGIPILEGRDFAASDDSSGHVLVIDESLARRYFPQGSAVGQSLRIDTSAYTVVGVVKHARLYRLDADDRGQAYAPHAAFPSNWMSVALRTTGDLTALGEAAKGVIRSIDRDQPISRIIPMTAVVAESLAERRLVMVLISGFAAVAVLLAALGIYGITASAVAQRTREIGIRVALGAEPNRLVWMVMRQPLLLVAGGLGL